MHQNTPTADGRWALAATSRGRVLLVVVLGDAYSGNLGSRPRRGVTRTQQRSRRGSATMFRFPQLHVSVFRKLSSQRLQYEMMKCQQALANMVETLTSRVKVLFPNTPPTPSISVTSRCRSALSQNRGPVKTGPLLSPAIIGENRLG